MASEEVKSTTTTAVEGPRFTTPIKTIVVLIQENRSFDHMLGWMKSTLNSNIDGVNSTDEFFNPLDTSKPDDSSSNRIYFRNESVYVDSDPGHSIQDIYEQVFGEPWSEESSTKKLKPTMQGFAQNANRNKPGMSETVMNGFTPEKVPVYNSLVSEFAVCDRWFASMPASTQPNRLFVHSATSHGLTSNDTKILIKGLPQKTIFESVHEAGYSFGIYYQYPPSTLFYRNLRKLKYLTHFHQFDLHFTSHCKSGTLPNYVVIEQRYFDLKLLPGNDDHPSHDVSEGQNFVKRVYESLRTSPQWNEILFIITYDEHGGFYDHVPTPTESVPSPDGIVGVAPYKFKFDRLGVRVPAIFVSPWIEKGTVLHEPVGVNGSQYEHSSIPATVKKLFGLKDFLTKRDAWAGCFDVVINRETPRTDCPLTLPEAVKLRDTPAKEDKKLSDFQSELVQMAACLRGDHVKDSYPHGLVESMTVADAVTYVHEAFHLFVENCQRKEQEERDKEVGPSQSEADDARDGEVVMMEEQMNEHGLADDSGVVVQEEKEDDVVDEVAHAQLIDNENKLKEEDDQMMEQQKEKEEMAPIAQQPIDVESQRKEEKGEDDDMPKPISPAAHVGRDESEHHKIKDVPSDQMLTQRHTSSAPDGNAKIKMTKQDDNKITRRKRSSFVHKLCSCLACV